MGIETPVWAVIPAAGSGSRMESSKPKQYLEFHDKTVLEHSIDRLLSMPEIDGAVLVLSEDDSYWEKLGYQAAKPLFLASGGAERQHSVVNGLQMLQYRCGNDCLALVHDAVRPLVRPQDLSRVIRAARDHTAGAILATPVADTLKLENAAGEIDCTQPRVGLWRALTPQVFHLQSLLNAYSRLADQKRSVTDDAEAMELSGLAPRLIRCDAGNIKITTPEDLELARLLWLYQRDQQDDE